MVGLLQCAGCTSKFNTGQRAVAVPYAFVTAIVTVRWLMPGAIGVNGTLHCYSNHDVVANSNAAALTPLPCKTALAQLSSRHQ
jgi:hypothetical protein